MPDHLHILIGLRPVQSISELVQDIKGSCSKWINENKLVRGQFAWQESYGAFSYGASQLEKVIQYIENQEVSHQNKTFMQEDEAFLKSFAIDYDQKHIFKPIE
jgi:REP element-mobilizing transposase RayT